MFKNFKPRVVLLSGLVLFSFAVLLFAVLPQVGSFTQSLQVLRSANLVLVMLAIIASYVSSFAAAGIYWSLSPRPLAYRFALITQLAGLLVNRLLPAGVGGMGLNFLMLRRAGNTKVVATSIVALNSLLGSIGHTIVLTALTIYALVIGLAYQLQLPRSVVVVGSLLIATWVLLWLFRKRLPKKVLAQIAALIAYYKKNGPKVGGAVLLACLITFSHGVSFWLCCAALNIEIQLVVAVYVFTAGVLVGAVSPTPGGVGGFEAGLTVALIGAGFDAGISLAAALLYRLVSFWLGLVVGAGVSPLLIRAYRPSQRAH